MSNRTWLDALTDGQIIRDWFSLILQFALGSTYFFFFIFGLMISLGLSVVLIGIPLLLFMLANIRAVAALDQRLMGALIDVKTAPVTDDVDLRGANLGQRLGMMLGSLTTWRSLVYLALKFPVGIAAISAAFIILPFLAIEVLILGPLTIDMRLATVRLLRMVAVAAHRIPAFILPTDPVAAKRKRDLSRLESTDSAEPAYYLEDDGEIAYRRQI
ncbi:MAG: sensor domain-containing protein [Anaerolineae bacterium]|nr:sensor domain-containing protein [Anaerolineae bacterium]